MLHGGVNYLAQFHRAVTDRAELEPRQSARAWLLNQYTILPLNFMFIVTYKAFHKMMGNESSMTC